jgi:hypothetical protein
MGVGASRGAMAQAEPAPIDLVVKAGRPLRVALEDRVTVKRAGQTIRGTIVEPVYAYDRVVIPAGTKLSGHITKLEGPSKGRRAAAYFNGDFAPSRQITLEFDSMLLNGRAIPIQTVVTGGIENVRRLVAGGPAKKGRAGEAVDRARQQVEQQVRDAVSAITQPGRMGRLRDRLIRQLPYHPQFLAKGTVYNASLVSALSFGSVQPIARAPVGVLPDPASILNAWLTTSLDSAKTPRDTAIVGVISAPVFSADHHLILSEGSELKGTVTLAKQARHFHRNGRLRFLFERVETTDREATELRASLYSMETGGGDSVAVDEEGGVAATNSNARFVAPALAIFAMSVAADPGEGAGDAGEVTGRGAAVGTGGARSVGGFLGLGVAGAVLAHFSRPVAVGLAAIGVGRTVYGAVFGKGQEVRLPAYTPIQVQLAPAPAAAR